MNSFYLKLLKPFNCIVTWPTSSLPQWDKKIT